MEDEDKAPVTRVQQMSSAAFDVLKEKGVSKCTLEISEDQLQDEIDDKTKALIKNAVFAAYFRYSHQLSNDDIFAATNAAIETLCVIQSQPPDNKPIPELRELAPKSFQQDYKGNADISFQRYLAGCCYAYFNHGNEEMYTAPYVTITQSSGFGKSRILKRLAEKENLKHGNVSFDTKVLYVCARDIKGSSGYPRATPELCNWLFPAHACAEPDLTTALQKAFKYSVENPDARKHWMKLFEVDSGDKNMQRELDNVQLDSTTSKDPMEELQKHPTVPVLVVAIDEARALLTKRNSNGDNTFRTLRRALRNVNTTATVRNAKGLVFGILVDTNSRVHEFVPALSQDPSSRLSATKNMALFPPFILTATMDIMLGVESTSSMSEDNINMDSEFDSDDDSKMSDLRIVDQKTSRSRVLSTNKEDVWTALVSMGRPLWHSLDDTTKRLSARKTILARFAARKLLIGLDMNNVESYTDSTLHGVSSLFCRIGLRPYASSPIVTRLVADFMSVLHYVGYKNDTHVSGYVSEPILTFGATRMWYQFEDPTTNSPSALESDILPQLKTMLLNGLIDTGNIGELVVRIFLLLAMDAVAMGSSEKRDFVFSGEFCGVVKFVNMLVGKNPYRKERGKMKSYKDWLEDWSGWQVCFSQFVDLQEEPTEDVLWKLLDRRAAGTFPRGQRGADLLIPIFRPKCGLYPEGKVSFIVVQVKDDKFHASALRKLSCPYVFKEANTLSKLKNHEVIRLHVSLREVLDEKLAQSIERINIYGTRSQTKRKRKEPFDGTLCVRGVLAPGMNGKWPFLSKGLAEKLSEVANAAWWDGEMQVKCDLKSRDDYEKRTKQNRLSYVLSADDAEKTASHTLKFASKVDA
ncbi:hypothetical protein DVH05_009901 [Phytophthora capsici]|nr:hypothetical protein DVH05_009901 [Phytophthora capsici]